MSTPKGIQQWAWDKAGEVTELFHVRVAWASSANVEGDRTIRRYIAIALMEAKREQREEDAKFCAQMATEVLLGSKEISPDIKGAIAIYLQGIETAIHEGDGQ